VRKTTEMIDPHTINENSNFYYVEVELGTVNLNLIGVQIDYRSSCPSP